MTIAYTIYFAVTVILVFVLYLAVKAITRGVEAKNELSKEKNDELSENYEKKNISLEISELKKMYDEGTITEKEFKKAKEKILN